MAAGKFNMQANDGAVIGLIVPDGLTSGERQISLGANLSGIAAYHLLQGNLAVSASTITQGFNTTLYTSGSATTGIDMSTQWGDTVEEKFGGLVWLKDRVEATNHFFYDTVRGATKEINSNNLDVEATLAGGLTSFGSTGFTVGADDGHNSTTNNMYSANFQTTHRVTGTTNHGKAYTCHFNPFTGFTIVKYEGSGLAGHEVPHMLGRKLGFVTIKNLSAAVDWIAQYRENNYLFLNTTQAKAATSAGITSILENTTIIGTGSNNNTSTNQYIMYGWANSYLDESNKLIGNYELVTYQGTGVAGNKVKTKGKPAWVMIKRTDSTGNWVIKDNLMTGVSGILNPNTAGVEQTGWGIIADANSSGFTITATVSDVNAAGGQYIALVAYDTNSNGGGSYYPLASDTANVQVNNALIPLAQGIDSNGTKNIILSKNETITGLTYTQGKNYLYRTDSGYGVKPHKPRYLSNELVRTYAGEQPDYFSIVENKWFNTDVGSELVTNGTFSGGVTTGWTAGTNTTLTVTNGYMQIINVGANIAYVTQAVSTVIGKTYKFKFNVPSITDTLYYIRVGTTLSGGEQINLTLTTTGTFEYTFVAQSTTSYIYASPANSTNALYIGLYNVTMFATDIIPTTEITNSRNYLNHIVHADNDGGVLYVEELPKVEYRGNLKVDALDLGQKPVMYSNLKFINVPYKNESGKTKFVTVYGIASTAVNHLSATIDSRHVLGFAGVQASSQYVGITFPVPPNSTYIVQLSAGTLSGVEWLELE